MSTQLICDGHGGPIEGGGGSGETDFVLLSRSPSGIRGYSLPPSPYHYCLNCARLAHLVVSREPESSMVGHTRIDYGKVLDRLAGGPSRGFLGHPDFTLRAVLAAAEAATTRMDAYQILSTRIATMVVDVATFLGTVDPTATDSDRGLRDPGDQLNWLRGLITDQQSELEELRARLPVVDPSTSDESGEIL